MHTVYLAEALQALGHQVCIFALAKAGAEFCRPIACEYRLIPALPASEDVEALVKQRVQEFVDYLEQEQDSQPFDIYHAQDCISANALAILRERRHIPHYLRTVHHIDDFNHPYLIDCQERSIRLPNLCLCVSQYWQEQIEKQYQIKPARVINGVEVQRFRGESRESELEKLRSFKQTLGLNGHPIYLTVGGIEPRKNSITLIKAFAQVLPIHPTAQLVIAGGDTFFDFSAYREQFFDAVHSLNIGLSLLIPGVISMDDLPRLYRCADAFVFPSLKEGWGLVILEAIAAGLPVLTSKLPPFTEFLKETQAVLVNPDDPSEIAQGMTAIAEPEQAHTLVRNSQTILENYTWEVSAQMHLQHYVQILERHCPSPVSPT